MYYSNRLYGPFGLRAAISQFQNYPAFWQNRSSFHMKSQLSKKEAAFNTSASAEAPAKPEASAKPAIQTPAPEAKNDVVKNFLLMAQNGRGYARTFKEQPPEVQLRIAAALKKSAATGDDDSKNILNEISNASAFTGVPGDSVSHSVLANDRDSRWLILFKLNLDKAQKAGSANPYKDALKATFVHGEWETIVAASPDNPDVKAIQAGLQSVSKDA